MPTMSFCFLSTKKNDLEVIARELCLDTNFNGALITSKQELEDFAQKVNFPSHALILSKSENDLNEIEKALPTGQRFSRQRVIF